jgi:hypothetical protein
MASLAGHLVRALAVVAAVTTVSSWTGLQAEPALSAANEMCSALSHEVGECSCVLPFLEEHMGRQEASILLELWLSGLDRDLARRSQQVTALYTRHGRQALESVAARFLELRTGFQMRCNPPGKYFVE